MERTNDIKQLIDRFMEGDTSLDEEHQLYEYFCQEDVDSELKAYQEMFRSFDALMVAPEHEQTVLTAKKPARRHSRLRAMIPHHRMAIGVAASLLALLSIAGLTEYHHRQNYCEAYIYNRHVTDEKTVMHEMACTLGAVDTGNANETMEGQLKEAFSDLN